LCIVGCIALFIIYRLLSWLLGVYSQWRQYNAIVNELSDEYSAFKHYAKKSYGFWLTHQAEIRLAVAVATCSYAIYKFKKLEKKVKKKGHKEGLTISGVTFDWATITRFFADSTFLFAPLVLMLPGGYGVFRSVHGVLVILARSVKMWTSLDLEKLFDRPAADVICWVRGAVEAALEVRDNMPLTQQLFVHAYNAQLYCRRKVHNLAGNLRAQLFPTRGQRAIGGEGLPNLLMPILGLGTATLVGGIYAASRWRNSKKKKTANKRVRGRIVARPVVVDPEVSESPTSVSNKVAARSVVVDPEPVFIGSEDPTSTSSLSERIASPTEESNVDKVVSKRRRKKKQPEMHLPKSNLPDNGRTWTPEVLQTGSPYFNGVMRKANSIVRIEHGNLVGTGFLYRDKVVSVQHVTGVEEPCQIVFHDGSRQEVTFTTLVEGDDAEDDSITAAGCVSRPKNVPSFGLGKPITCGEPVAVLGPDGQLSVGTKVGVGKHSASTQAGWSGAPVVSASGTVVGVHQAGSRAVNYFLPFDSESLDF
jgi:hypothetical protein